jgi:MoaA/NifB/PqqE/SkfB family radical SAM enzyme
MNELPADDFILKGILDGAKAFIGPEIVQFDITNRCNNNCLCCWNNSPLLGEPSVERKKEKEYELPFDLIKKTIGELREMGTRILFLAGGGEPFMHPQIMEILRYAKQSNMRIFINTNFTLLDKERAKEIVDLKIDHIHVSLLAGTAKTYCLVHPNKTEETFYKMTEVLQYIAQLKKEKNQHLYNPLPHINLYYVIFNKNYEDINRIVDLAIAIKADSIEFTPIDVIPNKTDVLLLNKEQIARVTKDVNYQLRRLDRYNEHEPVKTLIEQSDSFLKRIQSPAALKGKYESKTITKQPCYVGWAFVRILANGNVNPCLKAHRISVGNIYQDSFKDIWNSQEQQLFRTKSFKLDIGDPYFRMIGNDPDIQFGCLNSCDNIQINIDMHKKYGHMF